MLQERTLEVQRFLKLPRFRTARIGFICGAESRRVAIEQR
jgi:hypothetical protein